IDVLLVHPGGPFWRNRDLGAWSIPKGELDDGEDAEAAARREFKEEPGTATMAALNGPREVAVPCMFPRSIARRGSLFPSREKRFSPVSGRFSIAWNHSVTADRHRMADYNIAFHLLADCARRSFANESRHDSFEEDII